MEKIVNGKKKKKVKLFTKENGQQEKTHLQIVYKISRKKIDSGIADYEIIKVQHLIDFIKF